MLKKWNSAYLLFNDDTNSYAVSAINDEGNTVTLVTDAAFRTIMKQKYFIFNMLTPGFFDPDQNKWIDIFTTKTEAIAYFKSIFDTWMNDKKAGYLKLYEALRTSYVPTDNYDKIIHSTMEYAGTETNTNTPTGSETETYSKSGKETITETPTGTETNTLTKSGTETSTETPTGTEQVQHSLGQGTNTTSKTTFDSSTFYDTEKSVEASKTNTDTTSFTDRQNETELSFTNRQDTESKTFTNRKTETETSYTNRQDTNTKTFTGRQTVDAKTFDDRVDTYDYHEWGNIGVRSAQDLIMNGQIPLTDLDKLQHYIVNDFVHSNLII